MATKKIPIVMDIKTALDSRAFENFKRSFAKLTKAEKSPFEEINADITKMSRLLSIIDNYKLNTGNVEDYQRKIEELQDIIVKLNESFKELDVSQSLRADEIGKKSAELLKVKEKIAHMTGATDTGSIKEQTKGSAQKEYEEALKKFNKRYNDKRNSGDTKGKTAASKKLEKLGKKAETERQKIEKAWEQVKHLENELEQLRKVSPTAAAAYQALGKAIRSTEPAQEEFNRQVEENNKALQELAVEDATQAVKRFATRFLGLGAVFHTAQRQIHKLVDTFQTLDAGLTQIAVVTGRTRDDMWGMIGTYNEMAQRLGVTTNDVVESSKLFFQQGRSQSEVMELVEQTTILATISEIDFTEATEYMTAAINGFKLEAEQAVEVTDVWANLAAQAAVDADELAKSISKVASLASNAGMSLESTSAFLTQMIETTREAPENLGTALKTIIARFQELKTAEDELEDGVSVNKVEEALAKADVALRDVTGQFRNFDDVIMELSLKWKTLDRNTQRYIATIAAGSRQQSRFISLVEDYDRLVELSNIAADSAGASTAQFGTQLTGIAASMNRLQSAWEGFYTSLQNGPTLISAVIDGLAILVDALSSLGIVGTAAVSTTGVIIGNVLIKTIAAQITSGTATKGLISAAQQLGTTFGTTLARFAGKIAIIAPYAAVLAAVTALAGGFVYLVTAQERERKQTLKNIDAHKQASAQATQSAKSLEALRKEYEKTYLAGEDLSDIRQKIIDQYPELRGQLADETLSWTEINNILKEHIKLKNQIAASEKLGELKERQNKKDQDYKAAADQLEYYDNRIRQLSNQAYGPLSDQEKADLEQLKKQAEEAGNVLTKLNQEKIELSKSDASILVKGLDIEIDEDQRDLANTIMQAIHDDFQDNFAIEETIQIDGKVETKFRLTSSAEHKFNSDLDKITKYIANTTDEKLQEALSTGNFQDYSEQQLKQLTDTLKTENITTYNTIIENYKATLNQRRQALELEAKDGGYGWNEETIKQLSLNQVKSIQAALKDAEKPVQEAIKDFYRNVNAATIADLKTIGQESNNEGFIQLADTLQNLNFSSENLDGIESALYMMQREGLATTDVYKELLFVWTELGGEIETDVFSNFMSSIEQFKTGLTEGLKMDEAINLMVEYGDVIDESALQLDILTGQYHLSTEAAEALTNAKKQETLATLENQERLLSNQKVLYEDLIAEYQNIDAQQALEKSHYHTSESTTFLTLALAKLKHMLGMITDAELVEVETNYQLSKQLKEYAASSEEERKALIESAQAKLEGINTSLSFIQAQKEGLSTIEASAFLTDKHTGSVNAQTAALERQKKAIQDNIDALQAEIDAIQKDIDAREYQIDLIQRQVDEKQRLIDQLERERDLFKENLDKEKDIEKARIDAAKRRLEIMIALIDAGKDVNDPNFQNASLKDLERLAQDSAWAKEELEALTAVQKARDAYENAKKQKTQRVFYADKGWVWEADKNLVANAEDELNASLEKLNSIYRDREKDKLQDLIDGYDDVLDRLDMTLDQKQQMERFDKEFANKTYEEMLADLNNYVNNRVPYYQEMNQQVQDYDDKIADLTKDVDALKLQIEELEWANKQLENQIKDIQQKMKPWEEALKGIEKAAKAASEEMRKLIDLQKQASSGGGISSTPQEYQVIVTGPTGQTFTNTYSSKADAEQNYQYWSTKRAYSVRKVGFATGGVNDFTGPAMLHGTKSRPELVLNNSQSAALFKFIAGMAQHSFENSAFDIGKAFAGNTTNNSNDNSTKFTNCTFDIHSDADSLEALVEDIRLKSPIS